MAAVVSFINCIIRIVSERNRVLTFLLYLYVYSREILDHQDGSIEDDGLTGLLRLATSVIKHKPPFKFSREGQVRKKQ